MPFKMNDNATLDLDYSSSQGGFLESNGMDRDIWEREREQEIMV